MLGLGCGARSYTADLHSSTAYAVGARGVREILAAWLRRDDAAFDVADYGFRLDGEEKRRRFVILSLLAATCGLHRAAYRRRFGSEAFADLPELADLERHRLAATDGDRLVLTPAGVERSDTIGPWLHSARVTALMAGAQLR